MNNKGQMNVGVFVLVFIGVIVSIALFAATFEDVGKMTTITTATNETYTTAGTINGTVQINGRANTSAITVTNASSGVAWTANFTFSFEDDNGRPVILMRSTDAAGVAGQNGTAAFVSYTYEPYGYNDSTAARSIIALVLIFGALGVALFAFPEFRDSIFRLRR